jgi:uncharacterized protein
MKALLLALALLGGSCRAEAPPDPPTPRFPALTGRVVDAAGVLPSSAKADLARASEALERKIGAQYVVVTVPSLGGRPIEEYGVDLGRHWGIGRKDHDDGILLIVAPAERRVRIEVGRGLERRVTDPYAARVIQEKILPSFRRGRFEEGIDAGSQAILARLSSKASEAELMKGDGVVPW